jgi:flagellar biosynthetic protein FlhB
MADSNKTEKATPKKRQDERKKGNIFHSKDLTNALGFVMIVFVLKLILPYIIAYIKKLIVDGIGRMQYVDTLTLTSVRPILNKLALELFALIAPVAITAALGSFLLTGIQTRFIFTKSKLKPQFSKLNPINGLSRLFSMRSLIELLKSIIKVIIIILVVYDKVKASMNEVIRTPLIGFEDVLGFIGAKTFDIAISVSLYISLFAVADYLYQWLQYEKDIRMTKQEIKDEYKQTEGDPKIKSRIKEVQRRMASMRMMKKVPTADVIIRNPTHYAVALKYNPPGDKAPVVVAKGKDYIALKIIEIAEENGVHITENRPLARGLYEAVEIGMPIPEEFYKPVADILAFIYKLRKAKNGKTRDK